jgi:hypothetical protein
MNQVTKTFIVYNVIKSFTFFKNWLAVYRFGSIYLVITIPLFKYYYFCSCNLVENDMHLKTFCFKKRFFLDVWSIGPQWAMILRIA